MDDRAWALDVEAGIKSLSSIEGNCCAEAACACPVSDAAVGISMPSSDRRAPPRSKNGKGAESAEAMCDASPVSEAALPWRNGTGAAAGATAISPVPDSNSPSSNGRFNAVSSVIEEEHRKVFHR